MAKVICCPFYKKDKGLKTYCEGGCICHPDRDAKYIYTNDYCASIEGFHKCTVAKSMENYYERKDNF